MQSGREHRRYPRRFEQVKVSVSIRDGKRELEAALQSADVSFGGCFLASTFFLKPKSRLELQFTLPGDDRVVHVVGEIVRQVHLDKDEDSGFAIQFVDYYGESKEVLAAYFLDLENFLESYLEGRKNKQKQRTEKERMRDLLVAWEVQKTELTDDELAFIRSLRN